ncbi:MAG: NADH-quinone oxidoreductase subunit NuoG [Gallionellaceae bacterium]|nr:NADH-quinone oxidoreductase subunit NuoG [Gallionellaceae bacterium]
MPVVTIDDKQIEVAAGSTVMDAAREAGIYIPHFCYHKKLSIAASCRMCLVEVDKVAKPLPACATPVTEGMVVRSHSERAVEAQKGVMEFLLINHPLDCPVCDQGGDCLLQDIAMGYGGVASRYAEPKRVVTEKDLGPLVATDMTRCIHCSRCVRFGQEIAGLMELGMPGRGEHTEVMPFLAHQVTSELSGNVIDLCPVGALTSKPFRFNARPWELSRRRTVGPHDGLGANLAIHVKGNRVYRATPVDNEAVNECWLADRDRYSYEAINSDERLLTAMVKDGGQWLAVDWRQALAQAAGALKVIRDTHGGNAVGFIASPRQTVEELHLFQKLARALGCENIDSRIDRADFAGQRDGVEWLGMPVADLNGLDRVLLVGSTVRKEQPLIAQRLRQAVKQGAQLNVVHVADDDLLCRVANKLIARPSGLVEALAQVAKAVGAEVEGLGTVVVSEAAQALAASLKSGEKKAVLLGAVAQQHPAAAELHSLAQAIARATGATLGFLADAANQVGAGAVGCRPGQGGSNAAAMFAEPKKAYVILGAEPELEAWDAARAHDALAAAELVIVMSPFLGHGSDYAHVMLPIAAYAETAGSYVSMEGRLQSFNAVVPPQGEARPAWKVLRVLGNQFDLAGFGQDSVGQVLAEALPEGEATVRARLGNGIAGVAVAHLHAGAGIERLGETPIYQLDAYTRRAPALQATADGQAGQAAAASGVLIARLGLAEDKPVKVRHNGAETVLKLVRDDTLPDNVVRVAGSLAAASRLGPRYGEISLEKM